MLTITGPAGGRLRTRGEPTGGRSIVRSLLFAGSALRHARSLYRMWQAPEDSLLGTLLDMRPEVWSLVRVRFLSAGWGTAERLRRIMEHCATVERIGTPFDIRPNQNATLIDLAEIGQRVRVVLDSPRWLLRDGLLALSLFDGHERLYSIAFILTPDRKGHGLVAHVGGVQGRRGPDTLERYRAFTHAAHGMRPPDMAVELLRMICAAIGVSHLRCVSDRARHLNSPFASRRADFVDPVTFDYDMLWRERGGVPARDGFFDLPVEPTVRPLDQVPSRKRAQRRRRQEMLGAIRMRIADALATPRSIAVREHEPLGWP